MLKINDFLQLIRLLRDPRESVAMRYTLGVPSLICLLYWDHLVQQGTGGFLILLSAVGILATILYYVWRERPRQRFKAMADRAERLADRFARCNMVWDRARSAVLEMVKLRNDLVPLKVYIYAKSVALANHPTLVGEACEVNERTLRRLAALMRAGDLKVACAEFRKRL